MGTSSTTENDILEVAKSEQAELEQAVKAVSDAQQRVKDQEEAYRQKLIESLRGKVILFTGSLEAEDMFGQDGYDMYASHEYLRDARLVVTGLFLTQSGRFSSDKSPIVYATREKNHLSGGLGGRVSFRLLQAQQVTIVE